MDGGNGRTFHKSLWRMKPKRARQKRKRKRTVYRCRRRLNKNEQPIPTTTLLKHYSSLLYQHFDSRPKDLLISTARDWWNGIKLTLAWNRVLENLNLSLGFWCLLMKGPVAFTTTIHTSLPSNDLRFYVAYDCRVRQRASTRME